LVATIQEFAVWLGRTKMLAALSLGCRFHGCNEVHCLDRLGIAAFIGVSDQQTIELATYLLSPLDHEPELLATLGGLFVQTFARLQRQVNFDSSKYTPVIGWIRLPR